MTHRNLLLFSILIILFSSCRKNEDTTFISDVIETKIEATFLKVVVEDQNDNPIEGATIDVYDGDQTIASLITNMDGYAEYDITEAVFHENDVIFSIQHDDYYNGVKRVLTTTIQDNEEEVAITLVEPGDNPLGIDIAPVNITDEMILISGEVKKEDGLPSEALVLIFDDPDLNNFGYITPTDINGRYELLVPANVPLYYLILNTCNESINDIDNPVGILGLQEIGPFETDISLPTVIDLQDNSNEVTLTAQATFDGVPTGVVTFSLAIEADGQFGFEDVQSDANGILVHQIPINDCATFLSITITVTDPISGATSTTVNAVSFGENIDLGEIELNTTPNLDFYFEFITSSGFEADQITISFASIDSAQDLITITNEPFIMDEGIIHLTFHFDESNEVHPVNSFNYIDPDGEPVFMHIENEMTAIISEISNDTIEGSFNGQVINIVTGEVEEIKGSFKSFLQ